MRTSGRWALGGAWVAAAIGFGCGDSGKTIVDLTVVETLPVDFFDMQGGVSEGASFQLADMREEPAYVAAQKAAPLKCVAIDLATSYLEVQTLDVAAGATVLSYDVAIAPHGRSDFETLVTFDGSVGAGEKIPLSSTKFAVDASGLTLLAQTLLGTTPRIDVQITGEVPAGVDALKVQLSLALKFGAAANACASKP